jgi:beta-lactamase regulating signal transducer with metallopeptidase domain
MYILRGITISFAIFFVLYATLSFVVGLIWSRGWLYGQRHSAQVCCDRLFALRIAPFFLALAATLLFALPSLLEFGPHVHNKQIKWSVPLLALLGVGALVIGIWNAVVALRQVSKTVARWSIDANQANSRSLELNTIPIIRTPSAAPPLTTTGILRSRVWLTSAAEGVLTEPELRCALRHEMAHIQSRDNLRKLMLRFLALPGMAQLEDAWREASEMAADDIAVGSATEALDLAAAVIKLSRLTPISPAVQLTAGLIHSPAASVDARVKRLLAWSERQQPSRPSSLWRSALCAAVIVVVMAANYVFLLTRIHAAIGWRVR